MNVSLSIGDVIEGKYRIKSLLGEGGMGAVYEGENVRIQRRVAIKVLHSAIASDADATMRFEREAQAAGRIGNEHILEVLDLGELPDGDRFMVMEFLDGEPLSTRIARQKRLSADEAVTIFTQILEGLRAAHAAGIVHRDLKPDNIFLVREKMGHRDFVKIIDFGISKFQPLAGEMKMTRTGTVMGTPYYMSPEQASGAKEADFRSDLYSVGVMLYEALSGSVPFDAPTFNQLLFRIVLSEPVPIRQLVPQLDEAFATIVSKAMARDAGKRFQSSEAFIGALQNWVTHGLAVSVPPVDPGDVYLPNSTKGSGTPGAFMQRPAAGTPARASEEGAAAAATDAVGPSSPPPPAPVPATSASGSAGLRATAGAWTNTPRRTTSTSTTLVVALAGGAVLLGVVVGVGWWFMGGEPTASSPERSDAGAAAALAASGGASSAVPPLPTGAVADSSRTKPAPLGEAASADAGAGPTSASAAPAASEQAPASGGTTSTLPSAPSAAPADATPKPPVANQGPQAVAAPRQAAARPRAPGAASTNKPAKVDFGY